MTELVVVVFLWMGVLFVALAALGIVRMPDLFSRSHAATMAGTFGKGSVLLALVIALPGPWALIKALAILILFFLTAPVAAQILNRAAYRRGVARHPQRRDEYESASKDDGA